MLARLTPAGMRMTVAATNKGSLDAAIESLRHTAARDPAQPQIWRRLADLLDEHGEREASADAYLAHVRHAVRDPVLMRAGAALHANQIPEAEVQLRAHLKQAPTDVVAIRMLGELAARLDRNEDAEHLLARCLELAPGFVEARLNYALVLHRSNQPVGAIEQLDALLREDATHAGCLNLKAAVLCRVGEYEPAIDIYKALTRDYPRRAQLWLSYGHALKTASHSERAIDAYRTAIAADADFGDAYWSLANLKTFRFSDAEVEVMRRALARDDLDTEHRLHFEFALGKALEDRKNYADSFEHYAHGNALRLAQVPYNANDTTRRFAHVHGVYSAEFFQARAGAGADAADPIFIVGLPRSGSTLLEQILASHSQVEGTMELPEIISLTRVLRHKGMEAESGEREAEKRYAYHDALARASRGELRALGEEYLERTRLHRKLGRPFFIDKMPNNFAHIGLIHLALPNAKIIDARRHPLACCFSNFKQHFARGQNFSYSLDDIGRYYRDYFELMAHFDAVLPGRVHRVIYEDLIDDTDREVRRLLDYCGLPFDEGCLRFFENERPVRTASSEQVRQPINRAGVEQWKHYEPWLGPLKAALGPVLQSWNNV